MARRVRLILRRRRRESSGGYEFRNPEEDDANQFIAHEDSLARNHSPAISIEAGYSNSKWPGVMRAWRDASVLHFLQLFGQLGYRLKQIGDEAEIGDTENRGLFILINRNDRFGILHAGKMLNRAGNSHRHV